MFKATVLVCGSTPDGAQSSSVRVELEQTNRQGVARFMGSAITSVHMAVLRGRSGGGSRKKQTERVALGLNGVEYEFAGDHTQLSAFLDAVRQGETEGMQLVEVPCVDAGNADLAMADLTEFSAALRQQLKSVGGVVP